MPHTCSADDLAFREAFENCRISASAFDHAAHLRLAYIYLCGNELKQAHEQMREALERFLDFLGADPDRYHVTLTHAWMLAVRHFMCEDPDCCSATAFLEHHPLLLNTEIMLTHYSRELLFSSRARGQFLEPDLQGIPRH